MATTRKFKLTYYPKRKAPSACGEAPGAGGSEAESGRIVWQDWLLLRRLCGYQAKPMEFRVGKD